MSTEQQPLIHWLVSTHWGDQKAKTLCGLWVPHQRARYSTYGMKATAVTMSLKRLTCTDCLRERIKREEAKLEEARQWLEELECKDDPVTEVTVRAFIRGHYLRRRPEMTAEDIDQVIDFHMTTEFSMFGDMTAGAFAAKVY